MSIDTLDIYRQSGLIEEIKMKDPNYKFDTIIRNSWNQLKSSKPNESNK